MEMRHQAGSGVSAITYELALFHFVTHSHKYSFILKVHVLRFGSVAVIYVYSVSILDVFLAPSPDIRVIFDEGHNAATGSDYKAMLRHLEVN